MQTDGTSSIKRQVAPAKPARRAGAPRAADRERPSDEPRGEPRHLEEAVAVFRPEGPAEASLIRDELDGAARKFAGQLRDYAMAPRQSAVAAELESVHRLAANLVTKLARLTIQGRQYLGIACHYQREVVRPDGRTRAVVALSVTREGGTRQVDLIAPHELSLRPDDPDEGATLIERLVALEIIARRARDSVPKDRGGRTNAVFAVAGGPPAFLLARTIAGIVDDQRVLRRGEKIKRPVLRVSGTTSGDVYKVTATMLAYVTGDEHCVGLDKQVRNAVKVYREEARRHYRDLSQLPDGMSSGRLDTPRGVENFAEFLSSFAERPTDPVVAARRAELERSGMERLTSDQKAILAELAHLCG